MARPLEMYRSADDFQFVCFQIGTLQRKAIKRVIRDKTELEDSMKEIKAKQKGAKLLFFFTAKTDFTGIRRDDDCEEKPTRSQHTQQAA